MSTHVRWRTIPYYRFGRRTFYIREKLDEIIHQSATGKHFENASSLRMSPKTLENHPKHIPYYQIGCGKRDINEELDEIICHNQECGGLCARKISKLYGSNLCCSNYGNSFPTKEDIRVTNAKLPLGTEGTLMKKHDIERLKLELAFSIRSFCLHLFRNGRCYGNEYVIGSLDGETGSSRKSAYKVLKRKYGKIFQLAKGEITCSIFCAKRREEISRRHMEKQLSGQAVRDYMRSAPVGSLENCTMGMGLTNGNLLPQTSLLNKETRILPSPKWQRPGPENAIRLPCSKRGWPPVSHRGRDIEIFRLQG
jgi:hypothetical protein